MIKMIQVAALLVCSIASAQAQNIKTVLTEQGIVKFVDPSVSVDDLANMLYGKNRNEPKTRSILKDADPLVTVAMLIQFNFDSDVLSDNRR